MKQFFHNKNYYKNLVVCVKFIVYLISKGQIQYVPNKDYSFSLVCSIVFGSPTPRPSVASFLFVHGLILRV
jgi:hypothetical protein